MFRVVFGCYESDKVDNIGCIEYLGEGVYVSFFLSWSGGINYLLVCCGDVLIGSKWLEYGMWDIVVGLLEGDKIDDIDCVEGWEKLVYLRFFFSCK